MSPLQGIIVLVCCFFLQGTATSLNESKRKARGLVSRGTTNELAYGVGVLPHVNSYVEQPQYNTYLALGADPHVQQVYDHAAGGRYVEPLVYGGYGYPAEIKRYAVKEDVDEGYVTTPRPVYLPRQTPRPPTLSNNGWTPLVFNQSRQTFGKSIFTPVSNQIDLPLGPPQSAVKTSYVPVEKVVGIPVPDPYSVPVYQPYPVPVPEPVPFEVPLPVQVHSTVPVPVENPVAVPVVKHVPYPVVKNEHVPVSVPYPVPVPLYKTKYIVHSKV